MKICLCHVEYRSSPRPIRITTFACRHNYRTEIGNPLGRKLFLHRFTHFFFSLSSFILSILYLESGCDLRMMFLHFCGIMRRARLWYLWYLLLLIVLFWVICDSVVVRVFCKRCWPEVIILSGVMYRQVPQLAPFTWYPVKKNFLLICDMRVRGCVRSVFYSCFYCENNIKFHWYHRARNKKFFYCKV